MAACIRRNRSLLKWLALVLTMSSVLVWFGVTVGISSRDKSASASEGIGRLAGDSETHGKLPLFLTASTTNVNEIDPRRLSCAEVNGDSYNTAYLELNQFYLQ
ncbi:hypothetical protein GBAR_LOCUS25511 [Geodia barretti]|uniref:Uncharacterized protein n=1 Tax=Geodia barretti TaxID=519541 RepID=A0AA35TEL6_GEOBA|nr:hypothetical protein GBAR_LOCUS25511 [Geodia barretti]